MTYVPAQLNPLASFGSFLMAAAKTSTFLSIVIKKPLLVSLLLVAPVGTQTAYCDVVWAIKSVISEEKRKGTATLVNDAPEGSFESEEKKENLQGKVQMQQSEVRKMRQKSQYEYLYMPSDSDSDGVTFTPFG